MRLPQAANSAYAAYSMLDLVTNSPSPLANRSANSAEVGRALEFARKAKFGLVVDVIFGQLASCRSPSPARSESSSFDDTAFEKVFEHHLEMRPPAAPNHGSTDTSLRRFSSQATIRLPWRRIEATPCFGTLPLKFELAE